MLRVGLLLAAVMAALSPQAAWAVSLKIFGVIDIVGPSIGNLDNSPTPAFEQFLVGERVIGIFTFDETVSDGGTRSFIGEYNDPNATLFFSGQTSGTTLQFSAPLNIAVRHNRIAFNTEPEAPSSTFLLGTINKLRISPGDDFFTDPKDLALSIDELLSKPFVDELANDTVVVGFLDTVANDKRRGISIVRDLGRVSEVSSVPLPPTLILLASVCGLLTVCARRRDAKSA